MRLPMVPIVMNCTQPPLMTLRHAFDFGVAVGDAIRSYPGLERVALCAAGGLSHSSASHAWVISTKSSTGGSWSSWRAAPACAARYAE
jgi:hypothetical protein